MVYDHFIVELEKIAKAYRESHGVHLDADIPILELPKDTQKARKVILKATRDPKLESTWSHPNVAVLASQLNLKAMGFKPSKLAVPLPGEGWFKKTWRSGVLHAHKAGPFYVMHADVTPVDTVRSAIRHQATDTARAVRRLFSGKARPPLKRWLRKKKPA